MRVPAHTGVTVAAAFALDLDADAMARFTPVGQGKLVRAAGALVQVFASVALAHVQSVLTEPAADNALLAAVRKPHAFADTGSALVVVPEVVAAYRVPCAVFEDFRHAPLVRVPAHTGVTVLVGLPRLDEGGSDLACSRNVMPQPCWSRGGETRQG